MSSLPSLLVNTQLNYYSFFGHVPLEDLWPWQSGTFVVWTNFVKYHWHGRGTCTTKISHQLTLWDIIDYHWSSWFIIHYHWLSLLIIIYLKIRKRSIAHRLTTWNQKMLALLKTCFGTYNRKNSPFEADFKSILGLKMN